ncbi:hypothetical protein MSAN_02289200 [Mycena sanguinolenta]|uniref:Uncharacterized protein n=1 Tax=Mycena sanguinolenta TaxID=230812 RepID=A0A8H6X8I8_9AGAR|nr:hypothetical protein MSAN_02289200 [Mycena sanguinolenta]
MLFANNTQCAVFIWRVVECSCTITSASSAPIPLGLGTILTAVPLSTTTPRWFGDRQHLPTSSHWIKVLTRRATKELNSIHVVVACGNAAGDVRLRERFDPCLALWNRQDDAGTGDTGALSQHRSDRRGGGPSVSSRPLRRSWALPAMSDTCLCKRERELSGRTTRTLNRILPLMTRLKDLELHLAGFWLEGGIGRARFSELRSFGGPCDPPELRIAAGVPGSPPTGLPVHLPRLAEYAGSASFLSYLDDATVKGVRSLDLRAFDANLGAVLSRLAPCANIRPVAETLVDVEAAEVIETVGEHASQIEHMVFRARIPTDLPLADVAERLGALPRLLRLSFWRYTHPSEAAGAADTWGAACKTLVRVVLDGADWRRVGGQWTLAAVRADDEW